MRSAGSKVLAVVSFTTLAWAASAHAESPNVVVSIKPVYSLVAGVMGDTGTPHLLVSGSDSPHTYSMRPSDAEALSQADVVFWVGDKLETFLERPIENLGDKSRSVALIDSPDMTLMDFPEHGEHANHDHDEDQDHADGENHDDHDEHAEGDEDEHHHSGLDPHVWLDPANARAMVAEIVTVLSEEDPDNAEAYGKNGAATTARIDALQADIDKTLAPYREVPFFTFHESYNYFSTRFDLDAHGAITVSPEIQPGAQRLQEIREQLDGFDHVCVFSEPQFPPKLVDVIAEGTKARTGTLDPLGASFEPNSDLYFKLLEANRDAFAGCFQSTM
jgi:zinc transport system substrate-binding protein